MRSVFVKILYGVCGEGRGHASRSRILIDFLQHHGHEVRIVAGGKAFDILSKEFDHVLQIESPKGFYKGNKVRIICTLAYTVFQTIARSPVSFLSIRRLIREFQPDLLITDAEPLSHLAARFSNIRRISIDNPTALIYRTCPKKIRDYPAWLFLFFMLKVSLLGANKYIIYDFSNEQIDDPRVLFLKPLIQPGIRRQTPSSHDHIFVYQTSLSFTALFCSLRRFNETFIIYGFDTEKTQGNLVFKRFNENEFYKDIASAKAVIVNGGFTVISEALYLKKPIFSLPIRHQYEQVFNAECIQRMGVGVSQRTYHEEDLKNFFMNLDVFSQNLQMYDAGDHDEILRRLLQEIQEIN